MQKLVIKIVHSTLFFDASVKCIYSWNVWRSDDLHNIYNCVIEIQSCILRKRHCSVSAEKWRPFSSGLSVFLTKIVSGTTRPCRWYDNGIHVVPPPQKKKKKKKKKQGSWGQHELCYLGRHCMIWHACLTHLPWTKWPPFRRRRFQMHLHEWKARYF